MLGGLVIPACNNGIEALHLEHDLWERAHEVGLPVSPRNDASARSASQAAAIRSSVAMMTSALSSAKAWRGVNDP